MGSPTERMDDRGAATFPVSYTMAFQPIIDADAGVVFAHEALVRGLDGAGAGKVLSHLTDDNRARFDQDSRVIAIRLAAKLGLTAPDQTALLSINFLPNAVIEPGACIRSTVEAAEEVGLAPNRILFEFTEHELIDPPHLQSILKTYRGMGFRTAIDDFGAGYSGLTLLSRFQPDVVKLDMGLIRGIDEDSVKRTIVTHLLRLASDLGVAVVAEGIETTAEYETLRELGVSLLQGYLFAKPAFEALAEPNWPALANHARAA